MKYTLNEAGLSSKVRETLKTIPHTGKLWDIMRTSQWFSQPRASMSQAKWDKAQRLNSMLTLKCFTDTVLTICIAMVQCKQTIVSNILGSTWRTILDYNPKAMVDDCIQCASIVLDSLAVAGWVQIYKPEPKKQYFNKYGEVLDTNRGQWLVELKLQALLDLTLAHVVTMPLLDGEEQPPIKILGNGWAKKYAQGKDHCQGTIHECIGSVEIVYSKGLYEYVGGFYKPDNMTALQWSYYYQPIKETIEKDLLDVSMRNQQAIDHRSRSYIDNDTGNFVAIKPLRALVELVEGEVCPLDDEE